MQESHSFYIRQRVNSSARYQGPDLLLSDTAGIVLVHHRYLILLADIRTAGLGGESRE